MSPFFTIHFKTLPLWDEIKHGVVCLIHKPAVKKDLLKGTVTSSHWFDERKYLPGGCYNKAYDILLFWIIEKFIH